MAAQVTGTTLLLIFQEQGGDKHSNPRNDLICDEISSPGAAAPALLPSVEDFKLPIGLFQQQLSKKRNIEYFLLLLPFLAQEDYGRVWVRRDL